MNGLKTLIKLHKNRINDIVIEIRELEMNIELIQTQIHALNNDIRTEKIEFGQIEYNVYLEIFIKDIKYKIDYFQSKVTELAISISSKQKLLQDEFEQMKKYENLDEKIQIDSKIELDKKMDIQQSENIIIKYNYDKR